ncbi:hypothetical protein DY000_02039832 [Brassica cretica]|uniref:Retrotransposon gag domain-containing protein n=1 Tax=Brassica cretica TaxID=69181 RepID=A0ABQ7BAV5_BRACR|nr:hypothetical protein DY000_02039832 [Brassica cretica]
MVQDDATIGAQGGEPTPTPEAAPPITADFMSSIMARLAHQDEVQKTANDQLAALVAALTSPDGQTSRPQQIRRRLFNTNPTATGGEHVSDDSEPNETLLVDTPPDSIARSDNFIRMEEDTNAILSKMNTPKAPAAKNANTRQEPRQHAPIDKNGRKDGYMYVINENNVPVSTLIVRGEGWNKWIYMVQDDATFGAPGGEPTPTPEAAPPNTADFMSFIMARFAHQDEVQKTTNDQLAAFVAALTAPDGQTSRPQQICRLLFNTNPTATGGDHVSDDSEPNETLLADTPQ